MSVRKIGNANYFCAGFVPGVRFDGGFGAFQSESLGVCVCVCLRRGIGVGVKGVAGRDAIVAQ